jgi:hypothetical protein
VARHISFIVWRTALCGVCPDFPWEAVGQPRADGT